MVILEINWLIYFVLYLFKVLKQLSSFYFSEVQSSADDDMKIKPSAPGLKKMSVFQN